MAILAPRTNMLTYKGENKTTKSLRDDFSGTNRVFETFFLNCLAKKYENVRLLKLTLKPC